MALMLLLLGVVAILFDRMYDMGETAAAMSETNQNIRASINLIARDLTMAGTGIPIGGLPIPNGTPSSQVKRPGWGVNYFPNATGVLSVVTPGWPLGPSVIGQTSDEIHIVSVPPVTNFVNVPISSINGAGTQITLASGPTGILVGNIIMITNQIGSAIGMVTGIDTTNHTIRFDSTDPIQLNQPTAAAGKIANLQSGGVFPPSIATQIQMITYYLDNSNPDQVVRLMRQLDAPDPPGNPNPPATVANSIVALRFTYDLSDGTTINDPNPPTSNLIRKVNLQVIGRSSQPLRRTHQYFVNTMTTSVTIRNLAYRNNY